MKRFKIFSREKDEPKAATSVSGPSSSPASSSTDCDTKRSIGSESYSQNTSDNSTTESSKTTSFAIMSQRRDKLREFTFTELKTATKNFSRSLMIGEGGFGGVFRGLIKSTDGSDEKIDVAVKQLSRRGLQGHKEWVTELNFLGVVKHPNLVKLLGYCAEDDERGTQRLLVYEYMPNHSVLDHLSSRVKTPLSWETRLKIAQDAARGLAHLHEGLDFQIIFRDFKSSNILLDENWNAKLSDFGLARLGPSDGLTHVSTAVVGTIGYAAPEYIQTGRLTYKSDVWSYGVFLYELITGRRPFDRNRPKNEQNLLEWVKKHLSDRKKFKLIIDPKLEEKYSFETVWKLSNVAIKCLVGRSHLRPSMSEVFVMISKIIEAAESESSKEISAENSPIKIAVVGKNSGEKGG